MAQIPAQPCRLAGAIGAGCALIDGRIVAETDEGDSTLLEKIVLVMALCGAYAAQAFLGIAIIWWTVLMHEAGHFLAARLVGAETSEVTVGNGARLVTFRLFGARWHLRPLVAIGGYAGSVTCCITGGKAIRLRLAVISLAGPLLAVVAIALASWLLYLIHEEVSATSLRGVTFPLLVINGLILIGVLWENFVPGGGSDKSSVAHDMTQLVAIRRMTSIEESRYVANARRQVWLWKLTDDVLGGDHRAIKEIETGDLSREQENHYHWLRTVASWDFEPGEALESMDRLDELYRQEEAEYESEAGGKPDPRLMERGRELMMIHRASVYAGLHARDDSRTEDLAQADALTEFVDSKREPSAELLHSRGVVLLQMGRLRAARERLLRAFALPTMWTLRAYQAVYLAVCCVREGRGRDAEHFWRKALMLDPTSPAVRFFRSEVTQGLEELGVEKPLRDPLVPVEWLVLLVVGLAITAHHALGAEQLGDAAGFVASIVDLSYWVPIVLLVLLFVMRLQHLRTRIRDRRVDFTEAMAWRCGRTALAFVMVTIDAWLGWET